MKVKVKKLWYGSASVRDYLVDECFGKGENLEIELTTTKETMTVPHNMLMLGRKNRMKNVSRFKDEIYDLVDFFWRPDPPPKAKEPTQQSLL